ncbi:hypothetical protein [Nitrobacter sp. TKz-YC02]|uniref:hypothetical protein n=1 Tax=Nitrobacter sp. TKz-YC02 TaxID=3398704 RepID=UPI003CFB5070
MTAPSEAPIELRVADGPKWMSDQNVGRYRAMAHECRACAEQARYELDRQAWLKLAADWNALAEGALRRRPDGASILFNGTGPLHRRP